VDPADVLAADDRLREFLASRYPDARAFREWPISYFNEKGQLVQGWIDFLLELPDGYVIIDHKTTPNTQREHVKNYAPQLQAYKEGVELATGKKVLATLIHLPVCGLVVEARRAGEFTSKSPPG
jgi:ATP-dependent exoDNAse (exonuclease V) beta subunit